MTLPVEDERAIVWRRGRGRPRLAPWDLSWAYGIVSMLMDIVYEAALSVQGPLLYSLGATVATCVLLLAPRGARGYRRDGVLFGFDRQRKRS